MPKFGLSAALAVSVLLAAMPRVLAEDARQNEAGQFDFYVLSLSWSPSFCAAAAERGMRGATLQCGSRPYSFVVHGLWPQYDKVSEYCQVRRHDCTAASFLPCSIVRRRSGSQQWDKHGTCSGLAPRISSVRKARLLIPLEYTDLPEPLNVTPAAVEAAHQSKPKSLDGVWPSSATRSG
jgi:ribonuclease T2